MYIFVDNSKVGLYLALKKVVSNVIFEKMPCKTA